MQHPIMGIYHFNQSSVPGNHGYSLIKALQDSPEDDMIFWQKKSIFLGAITPINLHHDEDRQVLIVGDSNIGNREELYERLQVDPNIWGIVSDIQLILLSYQKWQEQAPKYIEGEFSFVIWDDISQKIFGARDYSGNKLLYYYVDFERLAFCTKMAPLLKLPYVERGLNQSWFQTYMSDFDIEENADDASITPYECIKQLPPGYAFSINANGMELFSYRTRSSNVKSRQESFAFQRYI